MNGNEMNDLRTQLARVMMRVKELEAEGNWERLAFTRQEAGLLMARLSQLRRERAA